MVEFAAHPKVPCSPLAANADDGHHAAGVAVRGAMGEEEIGMALSAAADNLNGIGLEPGGEKLAAVGFNEIDVKAGTDGRVAGRALREKEHGVFLADGIGVEDLFEQFARVRELGFEFRQNFFTDGVTTKADAGTDGGDQVFRLGTKGQAHLADTGLDYTFKGAAPSGVKGGHDAALAVGHQHGNAVGGLDGKEKARLVGDLPVGLARSGACGVGADSVDDQVGMELAQRNQ